MQNTRYGAARADYPDTSITDQNGGYRATAAFSDYHLA